MATITVGTNSYTTIAELDTYCTDRGITLTAATDEAKSILLIKAMDFLEVQKYKGVKTVSTQSLQFPRVICGYGSNYDRLNAYPSTSYQTYIACDYDSETVPEEIKKAQIVAAIFTDSGEDLQPIVGKAVKREKVGSLEVEYQNYSSETNSYTQLNALLSPFLANTGVRGQRG